MSVRRRSYIKPTFMSTRSKIHFYFFISTFIIQSTFVAMMATSELTVLTVLTPAAVLTDLTVRKKSY